MSNEMMNSASSQAINAAAPRIEVVIDVNGYLTNGADKLEFGVSLTPKGFEEYSAVPVDQNIILLGDVSGSMVQPPTKMQFMKKAMHSAVEMLPSTVWFAIVTFSDSARAIVELCQATAENKAIAYEKISRISEEGGTQMSKGLAEVLRQHAKRPHAACECVMLTDGANNGDDENPLKASINSLVEAAKKGIMVQISPRGVGPDFVYPQVNAIKTATNGKSAEYIANPSDLEADFATLIEAATKNAVTDVRLNIWMPNVVKLLEVKQTLPTLGTSMMGKETVDRTVGQTYSFPLGAMGSESVEYFGRLGLTPKPVGQQASAGKVFVSYNLSGTRVESDKQPIPCEWTAENDVRSTRIAAGVARAKGNVEMAENIQAGIRALEANDTATATIKFGAAAKLAKEKGDDEMTAKIATIVDIQDAATGTVRLKKGAKENKDATLRLESLSQKTVRKTTKV